MHTWIRPEDSLQIDTDNTLFVNNPSGIKCVNIPSQEASLVGEQNTMKKKSMHFNESLNWMKDLQEIYICTKTKR